MQILETGLRDGLLLAFFDRLRRSVHKEIAVNSTENERPIRLVDIDSRRGRKESHRRSTSPHSVENILRVSAGDSPPIKSSHYYRLTFLEIITAGSVISTTEHIYPLSTLPAPSLSRPPYASSCPPSSTSSASRSSALPPPTSPRSSATYQRPWWRAVRCPSPVA